MASKNLIFTWKTVLVGMEQGIVCTWMHSSASTQGPHIPTESPGRGVALFRYDPDILPMERDPFFSNECLGKEDSE